MLRIIKSFEQEATVSSYDFPLNFDAEYTFEEEDNEEESEGSEEQLDKDVSVSKKPEKSASEIISKAKLEAEEIISQAKIEIEELKNNAIEEGHKSGYDKGYDEGYQKALNEHTEFMNGYRQDFLNEIKEIVEKIELEKIEIIDQYCCDLRDIAISIAEKVIHVSLKSSGKIIEKMIVSVTEKLRNKEWAKIYISKGDAELMLKGDTDILNALSHVSDHIKVVVMENESVGTCIVELPDEIIDAGVNTQMENIKEILSSTSM